MRAASVQYYDEPQYTAGPVVDLQYSPRSPYLWVLFFPCVLVTAASWMAGGIPILTNLGFVLLTLLCAALLTEELLNFSKRFGLGAITLYGGCMIWFCYDYLTNWFDMDFITGGTEFGPGVIAKSACLHQIFILCAVAGMQLPVWQRLEMTIARIPEPRSHRLYLTIIVLAFMVGMIPYLFFKVDSLPVALWKDIMGGRTGSGGGFTAGRTGNVNTSWGAYLAQLQQVGEIGAIFGVFYVVIMRPPMATSVLCLIPWLLQAGLAFGGGTRGQTAYILMPALFLVFLKYQSSAAQLLKRFSGKAYLVSGTIALVILVILQVQITFRGQGFSQIEMSEVKTKIEGNSMFSEGLKGMSLIPDQKDFFYSSFPGHGMLMVVPDVTWRFIYGPIPRALWPGKPIDPVWKWYNSVVTGRDIENMEGTTVSTGMIGDWYFRFGIAGVIEGGLIFGWLLLVGERLLQNSQGRLIQLILSIGFLVFLFRSFRSFNFINLYPLLIGVAAIIIMARFLGGSEEPHSGQNQ